MSTPLAALPAGTLLVRVPADTASWPRSLPAVPPGHTVTVTLGHIHLLPGPADGLEASGYRVAGAAAEHRPLGSLVDLLVPAAVRDADPRWWEQIRQRADRVFDLAFGPVAALLSAEVELHLRAS